MSMLNDVTLVKTIRVLLDKDNKNKDIKDKDIKDKDSKGDEHND